MLHVAPESTLDQNPDDWKVLDLSKVREYRGLGNGCQASEFLLQKRTCERRL